MVFPLISDNAARFLNLPVIQSAAQNAAWQDKRKNRVRPGEEMIVDRADRDGDAPMYRKTIFLKEADHALR